MSDRRGSLAAMGDRPTTAPRNVDDVDYATLTGPRPMKEVLRERRGLTNKQNKATREEAFRVRAGMQASLCSCLCCYPLVKRETSSEHEEWCPAHGIYLSRLAQEKFDRDRRDR